MKNNITELVFILDRSGSMHGLERDTIGGFNSLIEKQKRESGKCTVTTILFDHEISRLHDRADLADIKPITENEYSVRGCTALLDAVGDTVKHIAHIHRYSRKEDIPEHTLFVIITDGMENASRRFSGDEVRKLVKHEQEKYGWEFLFLGANIDAAEAAGAIGIRSDFAADYHADSTGTALNFESVCDAVRCTRAGAPITASWKRRIDADYKGRK